LPATHPILGDDKVRKRLGGQIIASSESSVPYNPRLTNPAQEKVVNVLNQCLPQIKEFVASKVPRKQALPHPSDRPASDIQLVPTAAAAA
jgi:hypothetical protein